MSEKTHPLDCLTTVDKKTGQRWCSCGLLPKPTPPSAPPAETRKRQILDLLAKHKAGKMHGRFLRVAEGVYEAVEEALASADQRIADLEKQLTASESVVEEMRKALQFVKGCNWCGGGKCKACAQTIDEALARASALKREADVEKDVDTTT